MKAQPHYFHFMAKLSSDAPKLLFNDLETDNELKAQMI
jgi:hypothetical protein